MTRFKIDKKSGLHYFSIDDIRTWKPCYDPARYLADDWRGTAVDILADDRIPAQDRLWVVLRSEIVSERVMRLFAVWCARQVQHLMTDVRSIAALDVAERFANGLATVEELDAARAAAGAAAWAARAAAWAAGAAAWAARDAAGAARDAAGAARDAAGAAQKSKLIEMVRVEGLERVHAKQARHAEKTERYALALIPWVLLHACAHAPAPVDTVDVIHETQAQHYRPIRRFPKDCATRPAPSMGCDKR